MFGLRRFRFRSPERNRENDERRLARIRGTVRSAVIEAEVEFKGLQIRVAKTRRSVTSLIAQIEDPLGRRYDLPARLPHGPRGHRVEAPERALPVGPVPGLAQAGGSNAMAGREFIGCYRTRVIS
jgi:hypothetical protein